jgi:FkbM family methyltransferase
VIKKTATRILGTFVRRYRLPSRPGLISIQDEVSGQRLMMTWRNDSMMETEFYRYGLYGSWERHSLRMWATLCPAARVILDVGANTGVYSLLARKNNPTATIVALEPVPANADVLQANIDANAAGVVLERAAMSDQDGEAVMYMLKDQLNYMTSVNDDRYALHPEIVGNSTVVPISVPITTWATVKARHGLDGPDLIKIDVEGHEIAVMRSLRDHVEKHRPAILIEVIGDENAALLNEMLRPLDYVFISVDEVGRTAKVVDRLWDNDHQNFLICRPELADSLRSKGLVDPAPKLAK